jgi:hypothetical protein
MLNDLQKMKLFYFPLTPGAATGGQPPVAGEAAGNPAAESIASQTARHRGSMYMSAGGGSMHKKGILKTVPTNGGY